jgi:hypothetical protein
LPDGEVEVVVVDGAEDVDVLEILEVLDVIEELELELLEPSETVISAEPELP